jgi:1-acyl-sn-glycerol-3-phosphate acyltransferase
VVAFGGEFMSRSGGGEFGDLRKGTLQGATFVVLRAVLLNLCRLLLGMRLVGTKHVPESGPLLVVSNHLHNADPVLVSIACPRPLHFMAKEELLQVPVIGRIIRWGGSFPIARGKADRKAIRMAVARLDQGIAVGMFPEGTRSRTWQMNKALTGAGLVAIMGRSPIQPCAITGTELLPFNGSKGRKKQQREHFWHIRPRVTVVFGEPFELPETTPDGKRLTPEAATDIMMEKIAALLPEDYRGFYGSGKAS